MADGYILLHRCVLDKPIWTQSTSERKAIFITLLLMANHSQQEWIWKGEKFSVRPGQLVTSLNNIAKEAKVSIQNVRTALVTFEKLGFLTDKATNMGRLITIVNWHTYQVEKRKANKETGKHPTKQEQGPNIDLTPNNNVRMYQCKNDKKSNYSEFVSLSHDEYQSLGAKLGSEAAANRCIEILDNYKGANGKSYKSDYRAILNWVVDRYEEEGKNVTFRRNNVVGDGFPILGGGGFDT